MYLAVFKVNLKESLAYEVDIIFPIILVMLSVLVQIFVWSLVYSFSSSSSLNGVTLTALIAYFLILAPLQIIFSHWDIVNRMSSGIREGGIAKLLIRPISYITQTFLEVMPRHAIFFIFAFLPVTILVLMLGHFIVPIQTVFLFSIQLIAGYLTINLIAFLIGCLSVYWTNIYGISGGVDWIFYLLGGALIPISFLPQQIAGFLMLTPFPMVYYLPVATLLGIIPFNNAVQTTLLEILWIAVLIVMAKKVWSRSVKVMNLVGV
ncbi:MAG: ABC-2 family transporter protein [Candidatus Marsarchaeota archaeon]|nr:ABC-2 family transporter protein [Candidatus Marsarchaeota archaeon]